MKICVQIRMRDVCRADSTVHAYSHFVRHTPCSLQSNAKQIKWVLLCVQRLITSVVEQAAADVAAINIKIKRLWRKREEIAKASCTTVLLYHLHVDTGASQEANKTSTTRTGVQDDSATAQPGGWKNNCIWEDNDNFWTLKVIATASLDTEQLWCGKLFEFWSKILCFKDEQNSVKIF